jgi:hypothetical protein
VQRAWRYSVWRCASLFHRRTSLKLRKQGEFEVFDLSKLPNLKMLRVSLGRHGDYLRPTLLSIAPSQNIQKISFYRCYNYLNNGVDELLASLPVAVIELEERHRVRYDSVVASMPLLKATNKVRPFHRCFSSSSLTALPQLRHVVDYEEWFNVSRSSHRRGAMLMISRTSRGFASLHCCNVIYNVFMG